METFASFFLSVICKNLILLNKAENFQYTFISIHFSCPFE